jgi:hypothetical protein
MKPQVVHAGFEVKSFPDAGVLAPARAIGEKLAKEPLPG